MTHPALPPLPLSAVPPPPLTTGDQVSRAFFVLLIFVYILTVFCRGKTNDGADHGSGRRRFIARVVFANHPPSSTRRSGLGVPAVGLLPSVAFRAANFEKDLDCAICLRKLAEGEDARLLPQCSHAFHMECISMWFSSHSTCPLCRSAVVMYEPDLANSGVDVESEVSSPVSWNAPDVTEEEEENSSSPGFSRRTAEEAVIDIPMRRGNAVDGSAGGVDGVVIAKDDDES